MKVITAAHNIAHNIKKFHIQIIDFIKNIFERHTKKLAILLVAAIIYGILLFFGVFPLPRAYIIADFYVHKPHFERIVNSDFTYINNIGGGIEDYTSKTDDIKLQRSLKVVFNGAWKVMDYGQYHSYCYVFYPFNFTYRKARGVVYYESDEKLTAFYDDFDDYSCWPLGGGWYYYEISPNYSHTPRTVMG